jgi:hypothetical protein
MRLDFSTIVHRLRNNIAPLLWVCLVLLLLVEALVVRSSYLLINQSQLSAPLFVNTSTVRVNFSGYNGIIKQFQNQQQYQPQPETAPDPFGLPPSSVAQ